MLSITIALFVATFALFHSTDKNSTLNPFRYTTFDVAAAIIVLLIIVYAVRSRITRDLPEQSLHAEALDNDPPRRVRTFAAGGLTFMFFQALLVGSCQLGEITVSGQAKWLAFAGNIILAGSGIVLGFAVLKGNRRALYGARLLLKLTVAGGLIAILMWTIGVWPHQSSQVLADVIASIAILIMLAA